VRLLNAGSKYIEYISRIRNTAMHSGYGHNEMNETISQNMQSFNKQNVITAQYIISRDCPTCSNLRGK
jgi:hypothetical protein